MNKTKSPSRKSAKLVKAKKTKKGPVRYVVGSVGRMTRSVVGTTFRITGSAVKSVGRGARSLAAAAKGKTRKTSRRHKRKIVRSQAAMKAMK